MAGKEGKRIGWWFIACEGKGIDKEEAELEKIHRL